MAPFEMTWQAPEYEYHEKGVSWYWISIIVAACIIAFAVWEQNFLFGFFVVIAEVLFIVWGSRFPRVLHFMMTANGVAVEGGKAHMFSEFESMSIDPHGDGWAEVVLNPRPRLRMPFRMLFPEERLTELRANLKTVLKEMPYDPSFFDSIEKLMRF